MQEPFRYTLEKGSKKHPCPECGKRRMVRYIDIETGDYLPARYGRCERVDACAYFIDPYKDGYLKMIREQEQGQNTGDWKPNQSKHQKKPYVKPKIVPLPVEVLNKTLKCYDKNVFIQNLLKRVDFPFEAEDIENVISLYRLGTVCQGYRTGAITFPFIDKSNNVRTIQVKQFDQTNHTTGTDFLHSIIEKHYTKNNKPIPEWLTRYNKNDTKVSCLFGEHLLGKYQSNPIALVEAPKTAIYGMLYFGIPKNPKDFIWLAVYNVSSLSLDKCKSLKGRDVYLFPDTSRKGKAFELWSSKAREFESQIQGVRFRVSNLLEQLAPKQDKEKGSDLADYLITQDWRAFRRHAQNVDILVQNDEETLKSHTSPKPILNAENYNGDFKAVKEEPTLEARLEPQPIPIHKKYDKDFKRVEFDPFRKEVPSFKTIANKQPENWNTEIKELEVFFSRTTLPSQPIELNKGCTVVDAERFVDTHLSVVTANNGKRIYLPCLNRLRGFKRLITKTN